MKYLMIALAIFALPAHAFDWPWQEKQLEDYSYCKGFLHSGLASSEMTDGTRIELWLDWNNVTRTQFEQGGAISQDQYEAGKARFSTLLASSDTNGILDVVDQGCNFGNG